MNENLSVWIDVFRWIAAASVVVAHGGTWFVAPIQDIPAQQRGLDHVFLAFLMGFSHAGIMVFFVISGFLVGGTAWREVQRSGRINIGRFLSRRLTRLWIVIIPALVLTAAFDGIGLSLPNVPDGVYHSLGVPDLRVSTFVCNVLFLQTLACHTYGTNSPLWSLFNEFWYYLVAIALLIFAFARPISASTRVASGAFAVGVLAVSSFQWEGAAPMAPYFLIWCVGLAAAVSRHPLPMVSPLILLLGTLLTILVFRVGVGANLWPYKGGVTFAFDIVGMSIFAALLHQLRFVPLAIPRWFGNASVALASFTFTIYCIHLPLMTLLCAVLEFFFGIGWREVPSGPAFWLLVLGQFAFVYVFALGLSSLTEARTEQARAVIERIGSSRTQRRSG